MGVKQSTCEKRQSNGFRINEGMGSITCTTINLGSERTQHNYNGYILTYPVAGDPISLR
jgi:hypothetical protein